MKTIRSADSMSLRGLSDKQINEIGLRYWAKATKAKGSIYADHFIKQGMACQLELERREKWRKMK